MFVYSSKRYLFLLFALIFITQPSEASSRVFTNSPPLPCEQFNKETTHMLVTIAHGLKLGADCNNPADQYLLGFCYLKGWGVPQDSSLAVYWITLSAQQGFPDAFFTLGEFYFNGFIVQQDLTQAVCNFYNAAVREVALAQYALAYCCYNGVGVRKDEVMAVTWCISAAKLGLGIAMHALANYYLYELGDLPPANHLYRKAADSGYIPAIIAILNP